MLSHGGGGKMNEAITTLILQDMYSELSNNSKRKIKFLYGIENKTQLLQITGADPNARI